MALAIRYMGINMGDPLNNIFYYVCCHQSVMFNVSVKHCTKDHHVMTAWRVLIQCAQTKCCVPTRIHIHMC